MLYLIVKSDYFDRELTTCTFTSLDDVLNYIKESNNFYPRGANSNLVEFMQGFLGIDFELDFQRINDDGKMENILHFRFDAESYFNDVSLEGYIESNEMDVMEVVREQIKEGTDLSFNILRVLSGQAYCPLTDEQDKILHAMAMKAITA